MTRLRRTGVRFDSFLLPVAPLLLLLLTSSIAFGQADVPLYEQDPFDRLTLNERNDNAVLEIVPDELPDRHLAEILPRTGDLRIRLASRPDQQFDVSWSDVAKLELFEQMVLAEAEQHVAAGRFDEAFDYYVFLWREYPESPGLVASFERFLVNGAFASYQSGLWDDAFVQLREVKRLRPDRPGLAAALARVQDKRIETHVQKNEFHAARQILRQVAEETDDDQMRQLHDKWGKRLEELAARQMAAAQQQLQAGRLREAHEACQAMLNIWPKLEGADELRASIQQQYPRVVVGVSELSNSPDPARIHGWAERRVGRLRDRMFMELADVGPEGGNYVCPLGNFSKNDDGRTITIRLRHSGSKHPGGDYTAYEAARRILMLAEPAGPTLQATSYPYVEAVSVSDVFNLRIDLRRPHLRVEALLAVTLRDDTGNLPAVPRRDVTTPYLPESFDGHDARYVLNPDYSLRIDGQPREIVEKAFDSPTQAADALEQGQIDVVDRLYPADVPRLRQDSALVVVPYAVPTLHLLIANFRKPHMARRTLRRAIVYGIDRQTILEREILGGEPITGCRVISGPFSAGRSADDPLGYAYDGRISPRPYRPLQAYTLAKVAQNELAMIANKEDHEPPQPAQLVLAHPAEETLRVASRQIAQQLSAVGIECKPRELPPGTAAVADDDWDMLFVEVTMAEPLVDAYRLLSRDGLAGGGSAYLDQALRRLDGAGNWKEARDALLEIHRIAHEEVTVVPLWQIVDHLAYRGPLQGIHDRPVTLYQTIEQWRKTPLLAAQ